MKEENIFYKSREITGLKQYEVAERLNLVRSTISKWESGVSVPDQSTLPKLADLYGVSVDYLLGRSGERNLFEDARIQKSEIQIAYDELNPNQQENVLIYARALKAMNNKSSEALPSKKRVDVCQGTSSNEPHY